jgi:hypothetical protein
MPATAQLAPHTMRCLEVWGGNQAVDNGVVMAGLDAWLYSRPFGDQPAGGDIHYVSSCAAGMVTRVLVADVSGHGEPVAEAARKLRGLMRRYVNYVDQTRFVEGLNTEFAGLAHTGGFATAVAATYLAPTDDFTVCNAGHPRPLWYRARTREWSLLTGDAQPGAGAPMNVPLGVAEPTCYQQFVVKVATGDLVVLYTDSLIEARDAQGRMLGQDGLLRAARGLDPTDPGEFMHGLLEAVSHHASADDLTVLILRPNGLKPRLSMVVKLKALTRMVGAVFATVRHGGPEFPAYEGGLWARVGALLNRRRNRV